MSLSAYLTTLPSDILLNPAIIQIGSTAIGVTRGGVKFDPAFTIENLAAGIDGGQAPIKGLDRRYNGPAKFSGTLLEFGDSTTGNQIPKLEAGSSSASAGTPNVTTVTPQAGNALIVSGSYQSNVRLIWDRGVGSGTKRYLCLLFAVALCTKYGMGSGGEKEGTIDFEFEARKDMSSGTISDAPYVIELREALP